MNIGRHIRVLWGLTTGGLLLAGLFLLLGGAPLAAGAAAGDLFVTPAGSGTCTQAAPCDLPTALGLAIDGDAIYMAEGDYTGAGPAIISITHDIMIYGGWNGEANGPVVRDPIAHPTLLDGQEARRGIFVGDGLAVTLDGFTIANCTVEDDGAGLIAHNATLTLRQMIFRDNYIDVYDIPNSYASGGGAYIEGGTLHIEASTFEGNSVWARSSTNGGGIAIVNPDAVTVIDSLFQDNDAWDASGIDFSGNYGRLPPLIVQNTVFLDNGRGNTGKASGGYIGALRAAYGRVHIEGSRFIGNRASNDDGTVRITGSPLELERNVFLDNSCGRTAGLYLVNASPVTVTNNIFAGNQATYTSAPYSTIYARGSSGQFLHNTISRNATTYGILLTHDSSISLTNTILISHTVGITVSEDSAIDMEATLWGAGEWANDTDWDGAGAISTGAINIWENPAFAWPDTHGYRLGETSPAIDAGIDAGVADDIDGDRRPVGAAPDIGADEYAPHLVLPLLLRAGG